MDVVEISELLGNFGEFLGAIAVFVTLLYLARQIQISNSISTSDASKELIERFDVTNHLLVTDAALREALTRDSGHTPDQLEQIYAFTNFKCNIWVHTQTAFDAGRIDKDLYSSAQQDILVSIERWPPMSHAIEIWRNRYPRLGRLPIFKSLPPSIDEA